MEKLLYDYLATYYNKYNNKIDEIRTNKIRQIIK